jgi:hypothetical protein
VTLRSVHRSSELRSTIAHLWTSGHAAKHLLDLAVEAGECLAQFPDVALRRPGLDAEIRLRLAGDEVDLAAVRLDVIDDDVAVLAPPFGAIVDLFAAEQRGGIGGAVGDPPGEVTGETPNRISLTTE